MARSLTEKEIRAIQFQEWHDAESEKKAFGAMWSKLQFDGVERLLAFLSAYSVGGGLIQLDITDALALFLSGYAEGAKDLNEAWSTAVAYMAKEPGERNPDYHF